MHASYFRGRPEWSPLIIFVCGQGETGELVVNAAEGGFISGGINWCSEAGVRKARDIYPRSSR